MSDLNLQQQIEALIISLDQRTITMDECLTGVKAILTNAYVTELEPLLKNKHHLELFLFRVSEMRELQRQFFAGNRNVKGAAMRNESGVDKAMEKLTGELGYSIDHIKNKYEQKRIF